MSINIDSCIVCDLVRPELNGKLIILGYFGVCPNVDIAIQYLHQPVTLTFLFSGNPGVGTYAVRFEVIDETQQRVLTSTAAMPFQLGSERSNIASTLLLAFGHPGWFTIRCLADEVECFRGQFRVIQGTAS